MRVTKWIGGYERKTLKVSGAGASKKLEISFIIQDFPKYSFLNIQSLSER